MAHEYARALYNSAAWKQLRKAYFEKQTGICEMCSAPGEEVHHIIPLTPLNIGDPSITLNEDNLMLLCRDCHFRIHDKQKSWRPKRGKNTEPILCLFDHEGNVYPANQAVVVYGPPASGKTTYAMEKMQAGDIIVDIDRILYALTGEDTHSEGDSGIISIAAAVRDFIYTEIEKKLHRVRTAYLVGTLPYRKQRQELAGRFHAEEIYMDVPIKECIRRALADESRRDKKKQYQKNGSYRLNAVNDAISGEAGDLIKTAYTYWATMNDGSRKWSTASAGFVIRFEPMDLSFLNNAEVKSFRFYGATVQKASPPEEVAFYLGALSQKINFVAGDRLARGLGTVSSSHTISEPGFVEWCDITAKAYIKAILENGALVWGQYNTIPSDPDDKSVKIWTEKAGDPTVHPYAELVYSDSNEPPVCTALSPIDSIADGSKPVTFSWSHEQGIGMAQDKYDLQTNNGSAWTTLSSEPTSRQSYTAPENTLPAGDLSWRVRTYIKGGTVASAWSQTAHVIILAPPEAPYITGITSSPRPTVKWQAVGQEAFEAEVLQNNKLVYRSGTAASREQAFTVPVYLENGEYILRLRVTNTYGMASQWASVNFTVDASPPAPLQVEGSTGDGYASITVTGGETFLHVYLLRDGVPIAKAAAGENRDYRCIGTHTYVVRGVDENDLFADSGPLTLTVTLGSYAALAPASSPDDLIRLRYRRGEYITRSGSFRADTTSTFYCGREFPVVEFSGHREKSVELDFVLTEAEFDQLEALVGRKETLCYRTRKGEIFFGVLTSMDYEIDRFGAQVRGFLEVCDYVERIDYDPPAQGVSG